MNNAIRLSPSGPVIGNDAGGPFKPGHGAQLRLLEGSTTITGTITIPTTPTQISNPMGGTSFVVFAPLPDPDLYYRAQIVCDVLNPTTNANASVELYLDLSNDNGATWTEYASNTHLVGFSGARQIELVMKLKLGAAIGVAEGAANLYLRARIGASSGGGVALIESSNTPGGDIQSVGTVLLSLAECF